jgi:hypothetical protein
MNKNEQKLDALFNATAGHANTRSATLWGKISDSYTEYLQDNYWTSLVILEETVKDGWWDFPGGNEGLSACLRTIFYLGIVRGSNKENW